MDEEEDDDVGEVVPYKKERTTARERTLAICSWREPDPES